MKKKLNPNLTTLDDIIEGKYGPRGAKKREAWQQGFEIFRIGVALGEARHKLGLTQEELAAKCSATKAYISRIENNDGDMRLSTLMKIVQQGLGGELTLTIKEAPRRTAQAGVKPVSRRAKLAKQKSIDSPTKKPLFSYTGRGLPHAGRPTPWPRNASSSPSSTSTSKASCGTPRRSSPKSTSSKRQEKTS